MTTAEIFFRKTAAYRAVFRDRQEGKINHAYLLVCRDAALAREYLKALAKLIMCEKGDICGECRACRLIEKEAFADCEFYPEDGGKITADGIDRIVSEKCFVKPLEADMRIFAIAGAEKMNPPSQNKLLKTLEEPPKNVCILLGASGEYALLPTVKSRVKRLEIPLFSAAEIFGELKGKYQDEKRLQTASELCDGRPGAAIELYEDDAVSRSVSECAEILTKMKKSADIAHYSAILSKKSRDEFAGFLSAMRLVVRDVLFIKNGMGEKTIDRGREAQFEDIAERYKEGALLKFSAVIEEVAAANEGYSNLTMLADRLLFALLEENYRWQKL